MKTASTKLIKAFLALFSLAGVVITAHASQQVTFAWDPNQESDLAGYKLYYTLDGSGVTNNVDVGNQITTTVTGLQEGGNYIFYVTAYDTAGLESDPSNPVTYRIPIPNHAPTAANVSAERYEGQPLKLAAARLVAVGNDQDNDPLTVTAVQSVSANNVSVILDGDWIIYFAPADFNDTDTFNFTLGDGQGGTATATVTVTVTVLPPESQSKPIISTLNGDNQIQVVGLGIPGRTYMIQASESASNPDWVTIATVVANPSGNYLYIDPDWINHTSRFYRVVVP